MNKLFNLWKLLRYVVCGFVAFWGFLLIFINGIDSGGKTLVTIALIGATSTFLVDLGNKYIRSK
jgi:hypothetical protein